MPGRKPGSSQLRFILAVVSNPCFFKTPSSLCRGFKKCFSGGQFSHLSIPQGAQQCSRSKFQHQSGILSQGSLGSPSPSFVLRGWPPSWSIAWFVSFKTSLRSGSSGWGHSMPSLCTSCGFSLRSVGGAWFLCHHCGRLVWRATSGSVGA